MVIQGVTCRAVPVGGASTGWQVQVRAERKDDGSTYWRGIERYPVGVLAAAEAVFELDAVHGAEDVLSGVVAALKASSEAIRESLSGNGGAA